MARQALKLSLIFIGIAATVIVLIVEGFSSETKQPKVETPKEKTSIVNLWETLQDRIPFPYALPLPSSTATAIDGVYVKQEPLVADHIPCRRCPDWLNEGGLWKVRFDQGIYRVFYADLGWRTLGSYLVTKDRIIFFNDPCCTQDIGIYQWRLEKGVLTLQVIDDPCAIMLRGRNLSHLPWQCCQPPNIEAAVSGHWNVPMGCE
jgi:hypothetical protein